jgi:hypothetical protein
MGGRQTNSLHFADGYPQLRNETDEGAAGIASGRVSLRGASFYYLRMIYEIWSSLIDECYRKVDSGVQTVSIGSESWGGAM